MENESRAWRFGLGKQEITAFVPGVGMMGWAQFHNVVEEVESPLWARALVLQDPASGSKVALVVCDICFITQAVRQGVLEALDADHRGRGFRDDAILLTATHTHSGPGGYSHYLLYNITIPGFVREVHRTIVEGIVGAIAAADEDLAPGRLRLAAGAFDPDVPVAFNRALGAYNANPDVEPVPAGQEHRAVDREMVLLRLEDREGRPRGIVSWFAVHGTSVHSDHRSISADNKGHAARLMEEELARSAPPPAGSGRVPVALFAQTASGDVTPNFRRHPGKPHLRGAFPDDFESARHNGSLQSDLARRLLDHARTAPPLPVRLDASLTHADLSEIEVEPAFACGEVGARTAPAAIGMSMLVGPAEGPGMPPPVGWAVNAAYRATYRLFRATLALAPDRTRELRAFLDLHGEKAVFASMGHRRIMGCRRLDRLALPDFVHPVVAEVKNLFRSGATGDAPWTPCVLPVQIVKIGSVALVAVPGEFTTTAGRRLRGAVQSALADPSIERVLVAGYSNAYAGYVTTREEYAVQTYEGGSTHFGKWTLAAYQTVAARLAREMLLAPGDRKLDPALRPRVFSPAELEGRMFESRRSGSRN